MDQVTLAQASSLYFVIPFLIALYGVAMFLIYRQMVNGKLPTAEKVLLTGLLACYLVFYFYLTLSHRRPGKEPNIELELFWSYRDAFRIKDGAITIRRLGLARQILLNILVYMPLGFLLPIAYRRLKHRYLMTVCTGFLLSLLTEVSQYFTRRGLCELDDIFNNTLGCLLGIGLLALGSAILGKKIERASQSNKSGQTTTF